MPPAKLARNAWQLESIGWFFRGWKMMVEYYWNGQLYLDACSRNLLKLPTSMCIYWYIYWMSATESISIHQNPSRIPKIFQDVFKTSQNKNLEKEVEKPMPFAEIVPGQDPPPSFPTGLRYVGRRTWRYVGLLGGGAMLYPCDTGWWFGAWLLCSITYIYI